MFQCKGISFDIIMLFVKLFILEPMGFKIFLRCNNYAKTMIFGQNQSFIIFISSVHQEIIIIFEMYGLNQFSSFRGIIRVAGNKCKAAGHEAVQHRCSFVVMPILNIQCSVLDYFLRLNSPLYLYYQRKV